MAVPSKRVKSNAVPFSVPQTREQVDEAITRIGVLQRQRVRVHTDKDEKMAIINQEHKSRLEPLDVEIRQLQQGVQVWCESRRDDLTQGGKVKYHNFPAGTVKWQMPPPRVVLKSVKAALDALFPRKLDKFIRVIQEVDKDAILAKPEAIAGIPEIRIEQKEEFMVIPFETKLDEVP